MANEGWIIEGETDGFESIDFHDDPQEILTKHLTPKALEKLDEMLDSPDLKIAERAVEKVRQMDKRLQQAAPQATVNVLNFDPSHLTKVFGGMKEMLGERVVSEAGGARKALPAVDEEGLGEAE